MKNIREKKFWTDGYTAVKKELEDLQVLIEFYKEGGATEEEVDNQYDKALSQLEDMEFRNLLSAPEDTKRAVIQITACAGGIES